MPSDALLCAFLSLDTYQLYYEAYAPASGVSDCWQGLAHTLAQSPDLYTGMRVWEQIGYARPSEAPKALQAYEAAYLDVIQDSSAGAL